MARNLYPIQEIKYFLSSKLFAQQIQHHLQYRHMDNVIDFSNTPQHWLLHLHGNYFHQQLSVLIFLFIRCGQQPVHASIKDVLEEPISLKEQYYVRIYQDYQPKSNLIQSQYCHQQLHLQQQNLQNAQLHVLLLPPLIQMLGFQGQILAGQHSDQQTHCPQLLHFQKHELYLEQLSYFQYESVLFPIKLLHTRLKSQFQPLHHPGLLHLEQQMKFTQGRVLYLHMLIFEDQEQSDPHSKNHLRSGYQVGTISCLFFLILNLPLSRQSYSILRKQSLASINIICFMNLVQHIIILFKDVYQHCIFGKAIKQTKQYI